MVKRNWRRRKFLTKKKNVHKLFFLIIVGMTLGFAAITTTLQLVGTLNIARTTWNIHWANPTKTGGVTAIDDVHLKSGDNTTVEYEVNLANQGEYYEFTVQAQNEGTIDAMIIGIDNKVYENNVEIQKPNYLDFIVTYADDITIANNHLLAAGTTETYKVKVMYKDNLTADQLPTSNRNLKFTFTVTYMQADEEQAQPVREIYNLGDLVYFDPVSTSPCNSTTFNLDNINNNSSTCYKWRVLSIDDNNLTVQLDHNLINLSRWSTTSSNTTGPNYLLSSLATATSTWTRVPPLNYTYDGTGSSSNYGVMTCTDGICKKSDQTLIAGTTETPVRARVIEAEELKEITLTEVPVVNWSLAYTYTTGNYYFSNVNGELGTRNTGTGNTHLSWLIENTLENSDSGATANAYGNNNYGYMTLSPEAGSIRAWSILSGGYLYVINVDDGAWYGIRPVITMPKTNF